MKRRSFFSSTIAVLVAPLVCLNQSLRPVLPQPVCYKYNCSITYSLPTWKCYGMTFGIDGKKEKLANSLKNRLMLTSEPNKRRSHNELS